MGAGFPHSNRLHCVAGMSSVVDNPMLDRYFDPSTSQLRQIQFALKYYF